MLDGRFDPALALIFAGDAAEEARDLSAAAVISVAAAMLLLGALACALMA